MDEMFPEGAGPYVDLDEVRRRLRARAPGLPRSGGGPEQPGRGGGAVRGPGAPRSGVVPPAGAEREAGAGAAGAGVWRLCAWRGALFRSHKRLRGALAFVSARPGRG